MEKTQKSVKLFIGKSRIKAPVDLTSIDSASIDHICSEFILQNLSKDEMLSTLKEYKRILVKGGTLRLTVPDYFLIADKYIKYKLRIDDANNLLFPSVQVLDFICMQKYLTMLGFYSIRRLDIDRFPPENEEGFYFNGENITLTMEAYG